MPRRLLDRCKPDSVAEFRAAARSRYAEGVDLLNAGRRFGAIYLWGYAAEMVVKAACFSVIGLGETEPLDWKTHLRPAIEFGRTKASIIWPFRGDGHNVRAWLELLIYTREQVLNKPFPTAFKEEAQRVGAAVELLWRETLRYHKNVASRREADQMQRAVVWLLNQRNIL